MLFDKHIGWFHMMIEVDLMYVYWGSFPSSSLRCLFIGNGGQHNPVFYALLPLQWFLNRPLSASSFPWKWWSKALSSSLILRKLIRPLLLPFLNLLHFLFLIKQQHDWPTKSTTTLQLRMLVLVHLKGRHRKYNKSSLYYMVDQLLYNYH